jgi:nucleotide-binding universal stress UspA family protein
MPSCSQQGWSEAPARQNGQNTWEHGRDASLARNGRICLLLGGGQIHRRPVLGRTNNTQFRVIGVVPDTFPDGCSSFAPPPQLAADIMAFREESRRQTAAAIASARTSVGECGARLVDEAETVCDDPRRTILVEVERWHPDLVVLGSHGWRGVDRFLLGSVLEFVATNARCCVAVIRERMSTAAV